jgi:poly(3-hydroxybutyrate) depolymerase
MPGKLTERSLNHNGLDRRYLIHICEFIISPASLVIMLHGSGGTAEVASESTAGMLAAGATIAGLRKIP